MNEYNQSYIFCSNTGAKAFYENDKNLFYFTYFEGDKKSQLFYLFQALLKVQKGFYQNLKITDQFPLYLTYPKSILWFYDFISPFVVFIKSEFSLRYLKIDDPVSPSGIRMVSDMRNYFFNRKLNSREFIIDIDKEGIASIEIHEKNHKISIKR